MIILVFWIFYAGIVGAGFFSVVKLLPGIQVKSPQTAMIAACIFTLGHCTVLYPLAVLLTLFSFSGDQTSFGKGLPELLAVAAFVVNAILLWRMSKLVPGLQVHGVAAILVAAALLAFFSVLAFIASSAVTGSLL